MLQMSSMVIRIPNELKEIWDSIRRTIELEIMKENAITSPKAIKPSVVMERILLEFKRRDYYLLNANLEKLTKQMKQIGSRIENIESSINALTIKLIAKGI